MKLSMIWSQALAFLSPNPKQARLRRMRRSRVRRYSPVFTSMIGRMR